MNDIIDRNISFQVVEVFSVIAFVERIVYELTKGMLTKWIWALLATT